MLGRRFIARAVGVAVLGGLVAGGSTAGAAQPQCQIVNLSPKKTLYTSNSYADPLATAIDEAKGGDTLQVIGTCHGSHMITKDLNIVGRSSAQQADTLVGDLSGAVLSGPSDAPSTRHVAVRNLTITGGALGIYAYRGSLEVSDSIVTANAGTGIANFGSATVSIDDSVITDNTNTTVNSGRGGGIYNSLATMTIRDSIVSGNTAATLGGAIFGRGSFTIENSQLTGNSAANGGGIYTLSTLTITNSTVSENNASVSGGGIYNLGFASTLTNSTVSENMANSFGGGIYNSRNLTLENSTVSGNTASSGGGVFNDPIAALALNGSSAVTGNSPDDIAP